MRGDALAFLGLSDRGEELFRRVGVAAFLIASALSLIPMRSVARAGVITAGVIGAYVFAFVHGERGLDRLGWLIVMSAGVLGGSWLRPGRSLSPREAKRQSLLSPTAPSSNSVPSCSVRPGCRRSTTRVEANS